MRADGRTSEAAVQAHADALETSRKDARVLLWFATREGRKLDKKVLQDVVDAESKLSNTPTSEDEVKFWTAYRDLAAAVQPASVESILSTCEHPFDKQGRFRKWSDRQGRSRERKLGNARKTKRRYTCWAVGVLIALLLIQTYWFVVTAFGTNLEKHRDELDRIAGDLRLMTVLAEEIGQDPQPNTVEQVESQEELSDGMLVTNSEQELRESSQLADLLKETIKGLLANDPMLAALVLTRDTRLQLINVGSLGLKNKIYRKRRLSAMIANEKSVLQKLFAAPALLQQLNAVPSDDANGQNSDRDVANGQESDAGGPGTLVSRTNTPQQASQEAEGQFWDVLELEQADINRIIADEDLEKILSHSKSIPEILSQFFADAIRPLGSAYLYS